jgi:flagellar biosynthesis chaperone FliJ
MANAVQTKLQKLSGQYSAKVEDIRKLKADKRKPFVTDAQIKTINQQIDKLDRERLQINTQLTKLNKLAKTAEEYLDINKKLKELQASIAKAESRGVRCISF